MSFHHCQPPVCPLSKSGRAPIPVPARHRVLSGGREQLAGRRALSHPRQEPAARHARTASAGLAKERSAGGRPGLPPAEAGVLRAIAGKENKQGVETANPKGASREEEMDAKAKSKGVSRDEALEEPPSPFALAFPDPAFPGLAAPPRAPRPVPVYEPVPCVTFAKHRFVHAPEFQGDTLAIGTRLVCLGGTLFYLAGQPADGVVELLPEGKVLRRYTHEHHRRFLAAGCASWLATARRLREDLPAPRPAAEEPQEFERLLGPRREGLGSCYQFGARVFCRTDTRERLAFYAAPGAQLVFKGASGPDAVVLEAGSGLVWYRRGAPPEYAMDKDEYDAHYTALADA